MKYFTKLALGLFGSAFDAGRGTGATPQRQLFGGSDNAPGKLRSQKRGMSPSFDFQPVSGKKAKGHGVFVEGNRVAPTAARGYRGDSGFMGAGQPIAEKSYGPRGSRTPNMAFAGAGQPIALKGQDTATAIGSAKKSKGMSEFGRAFASARKSGSQEFSFKGKSYHTRQKGESSSQWQTAMAQRSGSSARPTQNSTPSRSFATAQTAAGAGSAGKATRYQGKLSMQTNRRSLAAGPAPTRNRDQRA